MVSYKLGSWTGNGISPSGLSLIVFFIWEFLQNSVEEIPHSCVDCSRVHHKPSCDLTPPIAGQLTLQKQGLDQVLVQQDWGDTTKQTETAHQTSFIGLGMFYQWLKDQIIESLSTGTRIVQLREGWSKISEHVLLGAIPIPSNWYMQVHKQSLWDLEDSKVFQICRAANLGTLVNEPSEVTLVIGSETLQQTCTKKCPSFPIHPMRTFPAKTRRWIKFVTWCCMGYRCLSYIATRAVLAALIVCSLCCWKFHPVTAAWAAFAGTRPRSSFP